MEHELTQKDTKMLQGLSVLAMVWLHLFDTWDYAGKFVPLIYVGGVPLCFYIAQLSDFCVFGFAFCSGYGHMKQFQKSGYYKRRLKGLFSVFCSYWLVMVVFSIAAIVAGQGDFMPGSAVEFFLTASTIEISYNGAWWYMFAYAVIVILSPLLLKGCKKLHPFLLLGIGFVLYCVAYHVRFHLSVSNWALGKFGPLGMTIFEYLVGAECCELKVFTKLYEIWTKFKYIWLRRIVVFAVLAALLYCRTKIVPSLFVAPVTGFILMTLFHFWKKPEAIQRLFLLVGSHSTNIWLTHMFFYLVLFSGLVYSARYPLFIFGFMLLITLAVSYILQWILRLLFSLVLR